MTGIVYTRDSRDFSSVLSEPDGIRWIQVDNIKAALHCLRTNVTVRWILIDANKTQEYELFNLLEYRGQFIGQKMQLNLYGITSEENMYLRLIKELVAFGNNKDNVRTETGVWSLFGKSLRFNLQNNTLPLLTTKRVFFKGITKELLWFLRGSTDTKALREDNIRIWDGNSTREYLDRIGLSRYEEGELGPIYGYQWRKWGKPYEGSNNNEEGVDQIAKIIDTIKTNPHDRRMILSAWNVSQLSEMALPPCHILSQFYVH